MDQFVWDVTKAAPVHAALAGVLATLAIAILTILSSLALVSGSDSRQSSQGRLSRLYAVRSQAQLFRQLVLATLLMLLSAIIWGGLAGHASVDRINEVVANPPQGLSTETVLALAHGVQARESSVAATAVVILALGALALVGAMLELVTAIPTDNKVFASFIARGFSILSVFAIYEVTYFAAVAFTTTWQTSASLENNLSLAICGAAAALFIPQNFIRRKKSVLQWLSRLSGSRDAEALTERLAVLTGLLASAAFVLCPSGTFSNPRGPISILDQVAASLALAAGFSFFVVALVSTWNLLPDDRGLSSLAKKTG